MPRTFLRASSLAAILLVLLSICTAQAQSGRRAPKASSPSPPPPPAEPEKPAAPPKTPVEPQLHLLLIPDISTNLNFSVYYPERVQQWVAQRLRDAGSLGVAVGNSGTRSEAIKRAKASPEGFVIFLQVEDSGYGSDVSRTNRNLDNARISYSLFSPVTGKSKASGVVYVTQRGISTSGGGIGIGRGRVLPLCYPGVRGNDVVLLQASLEVAERIMSALDVPIPPLCS
jgi:hypothetical protein